ncbi:MAG TPA: PA14 domain-containing protein, partial [Verrucomicrobiota bacterium]|nr:PA14 domain-containing protein [Verrucomicrobiota bacterium]
MVEGSRVWGTAGVKREIYFGPVSAALGAGLGSSSGWPGQPDLVLAAGSGLEVPPGGRTGYGQRFRGWLLPPETGNYTFAIASANEGQFWLSPDDGGASLQLRASSPGSGVSFRRFDFNPAQQTATVSLTAGQRYYFEVRHQADNGANGSAHLSVRWTLPSGLVETPIPAQRVQPLDAPAPGDPPLTFAVEVQPEAGTLAVTNGVATYTPEPNFFGTDSFVYRAAYNGLTSAPVVVSLNVVNQDDAPVAGSGNALRLVGDRPGQGIASTATEFNLGGGSFTLELWARRADTNPPAADSAQVLWHLAPDEIGGTNSQAYLAWQPDGTVGFFLAAKGPDPLVQSAIPYLDTDWHHWAVVFDADTGRRELFRDGVSLGQDTTTNAPPTFVRLHLGAAYGLTGHFTGDLDEVRLWTRARRGDELLDTMGTPLSGTEDDLFAYYRLDEGNGLAARDGAPPKPGGLRLDLELENPVTWFSGVTNLNVVSVPRNSPGQKIFLPGFDIEGHLADPFAHARQRPARARSPAAGPLHLHPEPQLLRPGPDPVPGHGRRADLRRGDAGAGREVPAHRAGHLPAARRRARGGGSAAGDPRAPRGCGRPRRQQPHAHGPLLEPRAAAHQ